MYDARAGHANVKRAPPLPPQMVTTKDVLNASSSRRGLHEGSYRTSAGGAAAGVSKDRRHMIDELNSQRNTSAASGNQQYMMDGVTSQESSFLNHQGGIVLMDATTVRTDRRVIGSEVPANIKANLNGSNIMGAQDKKGGIFNNTMGPLQLSAT